MNNFKISYTLNNSLSHRSQINNKINQTFFINEICFSEYTVRTD